MLIVIFHRANSAVFYGKTEDWDELKNDDVINYTSKYKPSEAYAHTETNKKLLSHQLRVV